MGTHDYVGNHGFPGVIIGLSGGIDSALVAAIACDAIGTDRVRAVQMPFRYTSTMSQEDSAAQAATFGIQYDVIPIEPMYEATIGQLQPVLGDTELDAEKLKIITDIPSREAVLSQLLGTILEPASSIARVLNAKFDPDGEHSAPDEEEEAAAAE